MFCIAIVNDTAAAQFLQIKQTNFSPKILEHKVFLSGLPLRYLFLTLRANITNNTKDQAVG